MRALEQTAALGSGAEPLSTSLFVAQLSGQQMKEGRSRGAKAAVAVRGWVVYPMVCLTPVIIGFVLKVNVSAPVAA